MKIMMIDDFVMVKICTEVRMMMKIISVMKAMMIDVFFMVKIGID